MKHLGALTNLVLKAVALAMGVSSVVLSILNVAPIGTRTMLLGIGVFALALAALDEVPEDVGDSAKSGTAERSSA